VLWFIGIIDDGRIQWYVKFCPKMNVKGRKDCCLCELHIQVCKNTVGRIGYFCACLSLSFQVKDSAQLILNQYALTHRIIPNLVACTLWVCSLMKLIPPMDSVHYALVNSVNKSYTDTIRSSLNPNSWYYIVYVVTLQQQYRWHCVMNFKGFLLLHNVL